MNPSTPSRFVSSANTLTDTNKYNGSRYLSNNNNNNKLHAKRQTRRHLVYMLCLTNQSDCSRSCILSTKLIKKPLACVRLWIPFCWPFLFQGHGKTALIYLGYIRLSPKIRSHFYVTRQTLVLLALFCIDCFGSCSSK